MKRSEAAPRTAGVGFVVLVAIALPVAVSTAKAWRAKARGTRARGTRARRTKAKARAAIVGVDASITPFAGAAMLALAAADEVVVSILTGSTGVAVGRAAAATEALLGAVRALERSAATATQVAIGRFTRGAFVFASCGVCGGSLTRSGGLEALFELRAIGGELCFELITMVAQAFTGATEAGVSEEVGALRGEIAAALHVVGVELTLLS